MRKSVRGRSHDLMNDALMNEALLTTALTGSLAEPNAHADPRSPIRVALGAQPEMLEFQDQFHFQVSGWARATHQGLAGWLLDRARVTSAATAISDLARYLTTGRLTCTHVMVLGGVRTEGMVHIGPSIDLIPFAQIGTFFWAGRIAGMYKDFHANYQPTSAILQNAAYPKAVRPPDAQMDFPPNMYEELEDIRRCMTSIGPSCPVWLGTWTELDESIPKYGSGAAIPNPFETGGFPRNVREGDWTQLPPLYAAWSRLPVRQREHLRVPLDRLNRAQRNLPIVDVAIELGVAVDALFLAEREADRGEQTLTLRLRASRYLAQALEERRRLAKLFGVLYRARSMAVHAGRLDDDIGGVSTRQLLDQGCDLAATALRRIILEGPPDWTELLYT